MKVTAFRTRRFFDRSAYVQLIAINNGIDSTEPRTLEFAPFINIMSEWYARDISKK